MFLDRDITVVMEIHRPMQIVVAPLEDKESHLMEVGDAVDQLMVAVVVLDNKVMVILTGELAVVVVMGRQAIRAKEIIMVLGVEHMEAQHFLSFIWGQVAVVVHGEQTLMVVGGIPFKGMTMLVVAAE